MGRYSPVRKAQGLQSLKIQSTAKMPTGEIWRKEITYAKAWILGSGERTGGLVLIF
jgi:hypothetical protein